MSSRLTLAAPAANSDFFVQSAQSSEAHLRPHIAISTKFLMPKASFSTPSAASIRSIASSTTTKVIKGTANAAAKRIHITETDSAPTTPSSREPSCSPVDSSRASSVTTSSRPASIADNANDDNDGEGEVETDEAELKHLQMAWRSPVYAFFKRDVKIGFDIERKYHFFTCAARKCKGHGGVRRYQDSKDRAATSNLKTHTLRCFGAAAIDAAFKKTKSSTQNSSVFAAFARQGERPVTVTYRAHNVDETRAHIVRWCAESNCPPKIVGDREFAILMKAGWPTTTLPSAKTVMRDVKLSFDACRKRLDAILKNHPGQALSRILSVKFT
ncbi:hypothetical protein BD779DRAFT_1680589 [Infundibulicybe gibba]|nr:hypothetical protein BD779DRAFT_1680589 [Infundibulicybe gibba]